MLNHTEKVYYTDSYLKSLDTRLADRRQEKEELWISSEQTIFYPGGGGQPADSGFINGKAVLDVKLENDTIWHNLGKADLDDSGSGLTLELDWPRRYYHMQQHSGQHLLSHVLDSFRLKTVSVHLGEEYTLIEVEGPFPDDQVLEDIEEQANEYIRTALPVKTHWVDKKTIASFPLRKPAGNWNRLRVVEIDQHDFSACGGTHVKNTAEIGQIKIVGIEKIRGHARIKSLIGAKADMYFRQLHRMSRDVKKLLQTEPPNFAAAIADLQQDVRLQKKQKSFYRSTYAQYKAGQLTAECADSQPAVFKELAEGNFDDARDIAKTIANNFQQIAFIIFEERFVLAAPAESGFDTNRFIREYQDVLNLKGGGPPGLAQGKIGINDPQLIVSCLNTFVKQD